MSLTVGNLPFAVGDPSLNAWLSLIERFPSLGHVSRLQFKTEDAHNSSFLEAAGWIFHSLRS